MDKEKKIIEEIAKKEGLSVVIDSSLVVCGITDITDKVSKAFEGKESKNETPSEKVQSKEAPKEVIGYLSQDKLYELKKMQDAQEEYSRKMFVMQEQIKKDTANLKDDAAKEKILLSYQKEAEKKKEEIFKPIKDEINKISEEICKSKGLIIILDKVDIFYGGMDITDDVMDKVK
jgi:outer membrane protein